MQDLRPDQAKHMEAIKSIWAETPVSSTKANGSWLEEIRYYYFTCASDVAMRLAAIKIHLDQRSQPELSTGVLSKTECERIDKELCVCHEVARFLFHNLEGSGRVES